MQRCLLLTVYFLIAFHTPFLPSIISYAPNTARQGLQNQQAEYLS